MMSLTFLLGAILIGAATVYAETEAEFNEAMKCSYPAHPQQQYVVNARRPDCPLHSNAKTSITYNHRPNVWPLGTVPYHIVPGGYYTNQIDMIKDVMTDIMDSTKIDGKRIINFKEQTNEKDYIEIVGGTGNCSSHVGRIGGKQEVQLDEACFSNNDNSSIYHELLHALGCIHEHVRSERDQYVHINWNNIPTDRVPNFQRPTGNSFWDDHYSAFQPNYDFTSVMHYRPGNPYGCGEVLTPVDRNNVIKRPDNGLSLGDRLRIRNYYNPKSLSNWQD